MGSLFHPHWSARALGAWLLVCGAADGRAQELADGVMMPRMDGMSFLNAIRADPAHRRLPVIIVTAKALTPEESGRLGAEAQAVLKKADVLEEDLKCLLQEILQSRAADLPMGPTDASHPAPKANP